MYQKILLLLSSSLLLVRCTGEQQRDQRLPYYNKPDFTPVFVLSKTDAAEKITHTIGDFSFLDQDSLLFTQDAIEGKIHVANFIFTSCGSICPIMTRNMKIISDSMRNDPEIILLSYSVTPWIDKPYVLKQFKAENGIENPNWHFLTGSKSDIYTLARKSYFAEEDLGFTKDSSEFLHTEHFILVDKNKRIRGIYNGTLSLEMYQLMEDIEELKKE